jgi:hypothetical protein
MQQRTNAIIFIEDHKLVIRVPDVDDDARTEISFLRTLRVPENGEVNLLPAGLGIFPIRHLDDFVERLPEAWEERGGVIMPVYQSEAMFIGFGGDYPFAIKIAAGKVNALNGRPWSHALNADEQDYVVAPPQTQLDGFCVGHGVVRQFVAMPLGAGATVEELLRRADSDDPEHGGVQIIVFPMKAEHYQRIQAERAAQEDDGLGGPDAGFAMVEELPSLAMGLAAGGAIGQQVYADPHGIDAWDQSQSRRCFVSLLNAAQWSEITRMRPTTRPPTREDYDKANLPWYDDYAADQHVLDGAPPLAGVPPTRAAPEGEIQPRTVVDLRRRGGWIWRFWRAVGGPMLPR